MISAMKHVILRSDHHNANEESAMTNDYFNAMREAGHGQPADRSVILANWEEHPLMLDRQFLFDKSLAPEAKLLYAFLVAVSDNVNYGGEPYRIDSQAEIAQFLGLEVWEIEVATSRLIDAGLVRRESTGGAK